MQHLHVEYVGREDVSVFSELQAYEQKMHVIWHIRSGGSVVDDVVVIVTM